MSTTNACPVRQIASRRLDRLVNGREHVLTLKNVAKAVVWYGRSNRFRAALPEHSLQLVMKTTLRVRARVPHQQQLFFLYGVCNVERLIRLVLLRVKVLHTSDNRRSGDWEDFGCTWDRSSPLALRTQTRWLPIVIIRVH